MDIALDENKNEQNFKNYVTDNPNTKALSKFALKLQDHQINEVKAMEIIGEGSHAKVYKAEYFG